VRKTFLKKVEVLKWSEICGNIEAGIKVFWGNWFERAGSSNKQTRNYGNSPLQWRYCEEDGSVFVSLYLTSRILSVVFRDSHIVTCTTAGHWGWPAYSSRGKATPLECQLVVILYFFKICLHYKHSIYFFSVKTVWNHLPILILGLWDRVLKYMV
jgi:hypothetical protein